MNPINSILDVINKIELAHGRLAANGLKQDDKKLISFQELEQLERIFREKVKQVLAETNLFDMNRWENVLYLLEWFDPDYAKTYLASQLGEDENIVKYMSESIVACTGSGISYEVLASYKKYLTEEGVIQAIEALKESGELFSMPNEIQRKCASFYLYATSKERDEPEISQNAAEIRIGTEPRTFSAMRQLYGCNESAKRDFVEHQG